MDEKKGENVSECCQICNNDAAAMFCAFCGTKLCKLCVGSHIAENPEIHKIIKYQDRKTTLVLPQCATHSKERCENFCQECDLPVCSICISSDSHERHKFLKISEIFNKRKELIKNDIGELEKRILPSYQGFVEQVESDEKKVEKDFETLLDDLEKRRKMWHEEIDSVVNALKKDVGDMKKRQMTAQTEHLEKLKNLLSEVQESIHSNRNILDSPDVAKALSYKNRNVSLKLFPPKLEITVPCFQPETIKRDMISQMFGVVTGFSMSEKEGSYQLKKASYAYIVNRLS